MNRNPRPNRTLAHLLCAALLISIGCKGENFGKTPGSSTSANPTETSKTPSQAPKELIPRVEYPGGDPSEFTNLEVGEEASIATDITGTYLSIPKGIKEAGKAIAIRAKEKITDAVVQSVKLVIPKNALTSDENLVVIYQMTTDKGEGYYGLIPRKDLDIKENSISFQPKALGVYQAAVTPILIAEAKQVPILTSNTPRLKLLTSYNTLGIASDILIDGTTAYVADGTGVEVLNWSLANGWSANTRISGTGTINSIIKAGNRIYVAAGSAGLGLLDMTNLTLPMVDARGTTNGIAVAENLNNIYLTQEATGDGGTRPGLSRFEIQQTQAQYEVTGSIGANNAAQSAYSVQISGTVAYVLSRTGIYSYDITQNDRIELLSQLMLDGSGEKFIFHANRLYVAEKSTGIAAINALTPNTLSVLGRLALPQVLDVAAMGKYLVAVDAVRKVSLIDISDPAHPLILNQMQINGLPTRVRIFGETIFITMGDTGVAALSLETPVSP